jgi:hypothetical protein
MLYCAIGIVAFAFIFCICACRNGAKDDEILRRVSPKELED